MRLETCELRMTGPRAREGLTPIISSVFNAEAPPELGELGGGDPCGAEGAEMILIAAVSAGWAAAGRANGTDPTAAGAWRRCGSFAIDESSSRTVCGRWPGSFASTLFSSWSSSSGSALLSLAADGTGALTVAYATSMRLDPMNGRRPVSISNVRTPIA